MFDDRLDDAQALWGVYAVGRSSAWLPFGAALDLYYLGYQDEAARFDQGTAQETRHTVGLRLWGERSGWDWNWELMYQFGRFGRGDIRAWASRPTSPAATATRPTATCRPSTRCSHVATTSPEGFNQIVVSSSADYDISPAEYIATPAGG